MAGENGQKELRAKVCDAVGSKVRIQFMRTVQVEVKSDKYEPRVLALSNYRLFSIIHQKTPAKVDVSFHFLDINLLDSKDQKKLTVGTAEGRRMVVSIDNDGSDLDNVVGVILVSLRSIFPSPPTEKLIPTVDVQPLVRLKEAHRRMEEVQRQAEVAPCGNFSAVYRCMCDYHGIDFMEDVVWDVDTIYLSQGSKEMNLSDFNHLDPRQFVSIISSLEHNCWFTRFSAAHVRLTTEVVNKLLKMMKSNTAIEELILCNTGIKGEFLQRLSASFQAGERSLTVIDVSENAISDQGISYLCMAMTKLSRGLVELNLSRTGLSGHGCGQVGECLQTLPSIYSTLRRLDLSFNSVKGENIGNLNKLLAHPNALTDLCLASMDLPLENLFEPLRRGCTQHLAHLDLSGNFYKRPLPREVTVPNEWKEFFFNSCSLQSVNLANARLPADAVKNILMGITSNITSRDIEVNLSGNTLGTTGGQVLEDCLPIVSNISSLDLSDNGFGSSLASVIGKMSQNRSIRSLCIGRNLAGIKQSQIPQVLEAIVKLIQQEGSSLESLKIDSMKLRQDTTMLINAVGLNDTLTHLDISGNLMGDNGARMLSKALQINKKLSAIHWDHNETSPNGFHDIAAALEKNYTMKVMPTPLNDAAAALRINQTKTEQALRKIESLLQRNHSPRKFAAEDEYRLQQSFLTSLTQEMDVKVVGVHHTVTQLQKFPNLPAETEKAIENAQALVKDSESSRWLLMELQKVAFKADDDNGPVYQSLNSFTDNFGAVVDKQLKDTYSEMVSCVAKQCPVLLANKELLEIVRQSCAAAVDLPSGFVRDLIVEQLRTEIGNKMSTVNLAVATKLSDRILDEMTNALGVTSEHLTSALRTQLHSGAHLMGDQEAKEVRKCLRRSTVLTTSVGDEEQDTVTEDMPTIVDKRTSIEVRKKRPQSAIVQVDANTGAAVFRPEQHDETTDGVTASAVPARPLKPPGSRRAAPAVGVDHKRQPQAVNGVAGTASALPARPPPPKLSSKTPSVSQPTAADSNLAAVSSGAPKLAHPCKERPRPTKTRRGTTRTVYLEAAHDDHDDVDQFFTPFVSDMSNNSSVVNGELENRGGNGQKDNQATGKAEPGKAEPRREPSRLASNIRNFFRRPSDSESTSAAPDTRPQKAANPEVNNKTMMTLTEEPEHAEAESKDATAMPAATTGAAAAATAISAVTTVAAATPAASKAPVPPPKVAGPVMNAAVLSELRKTMKRPPAHEEAQSGDTAAPSKTSTIPSEEGIRPSRSASLKTRPSATPTATPADAQSKETAAAAESSAKEGVRCSRSDSLKTRPQPPPKRIRDPSKPDHNVTEPRVSADVGSEQTETQKPVETKADSGKVVSGGLQVAASVGLAMLVPSNETADDSKTCAKEAVSADAEERPDSSGSATDAGSPPTEDAAAKAKVESVANKGDSSWTLACK